MIRRHQEDFWISVSPEYVDDIMKAFEEKKYGHKGVDYRESSRKRR